MGIAAVEVLEAAGIATRLVRHVCCGRPLDLAGAARGGARRSRRSMPIACTMPHARATRSCFSSRAACRRCARTRPLCCAATCSAKRASSRRPRCCSRSTSSASAAAGRAALPLRAGPASIALHAHCHQRAMGLAGPAQALLSRDPRRDRDRSRCRLLRHGRIVRLHARALRCLARDRRAEAASRGACAAAGRRARRGRHIVPASGGALHRRAARDTRRLLLRSLLCRGSHDECRSPGSRWSRCWPPSR